MLCSPRQPHTDALMADICTLGGSAPSRQEPMVRRLVWEFFCQVVFGLLRSLFGAERPFLVPSPAIRFAERAERCQGTEMLAQLSGLPLSVACVSQRLDA